MLQPKRRPERHRFQPLLPVLAPAGTEQLGIGGPRLAIVHGQNNMRLLENLVPTPIRDLQGSKDDPVLVESLHVAFARTPVMTHRLSGTQLSVKPRHSSAWAALPTSIALAFAAIGCLPNSRAYAPTRAARVDQEQVRYRLQQLSDPEGRPFAIRLALLSPSADFSIGPPRLSRPIWTSTTGS